MKGRNIFLKGAFILAIGAYLSKLLGALYRIPLTNLLGGEGLGLYQMVFPLYCILLDFAGAGAPNAISKIVSNKEGEDALKFGDTVLRLSLKTFFKIGLAATFFIIVVSYPISILQGNVKAFGGYLLLAPAVLFTALISCYRGYFQGKSNMTPTAISQVIEQAIKISTGLIVVYFLRDNILLAVAGATFSITLSEIVAFIYLKVRAKKEGFILRGNHLSLIQEKKLLKDIFKIILPVTAVGLAIPISQLIESFLIVNLISSYRADATGLYGLYSGAAATVIHLPVSLCYGIAVAIIPAIGGKGEEEREGKVKFSLILTFALAGVFSLTVYFAAPLIVRILFSSLSQTEKSITVNMLKLLSGNVLLSSLVQTENALFIGKNRPFIPLITTSLGIVLKTVMEIVLLPNPIYNINGACISTIACYFFISLVNLIILWRNSKVADKKVEGWQYCNR